MASLPGPQFATYEAGPTWFGVYRQLLAAGIDCQVAAPSKVQRPVGDRVKTDAHNVDHLAKLLRLGQVVVVRVPSVEAETVRDVVRAGEDTSPPLSMSNERSSPDDPIRDKWIELVDIVNRLVQRVADPDDFAVERTSSLAGDDRESHPFEVSQAVRHLINASVDQLDGIKVLLVDAETEHLAVSSTLAGRAGKHSHRVTDSQATQQGHSH